MELKDIRVKWTVSNHSKAYTSFNMQGFEMNIHQYQYLPGVSVWNNLANILLIRISNAFSYTTNFVFWCKFSCPRPVKIGSVL